MLRYTSTHNPRQNQDNECTASCVLSEQDTCVQFTVIPRCSPYSTANRRALKPVNTFVPKSSFSNRS